MELVYTDADVVVCVKPPRVLSTDEPGGVPELVRQAGLKDPFAEDTLSSLVDWLRRFL